MAERELAIVIRARDLASKGIGKVNKQLGSLGKAGSRAMDGLTTSIKRVGAASAVALVGAIALGTRSLGHLERVTNQTNAVIKSTGGAAGQSSQAIRDHAQSLEQLTTADDKAIQEGQNMLLTFTKIGGKTFPAATEATVNMAIAMAKGDVASADFAGTAKQVGKALNDPLKGITALSKAGVSFTAEQKEQIKTLVKAGKTEQAQALILKELAVEFGNAGKAAGTGFEADMRRVEDAGEDATQALARGFMPVLTRAARFLSTKLADPAVLKAIDELGRGLGEAAGQALDFLETVDFKAIGDGLRVAKDGAAGIVSAFMGMPDWVKTAVIGGWGLNKLSGGALSGIVGSLGSGLIKGVLGMNAGVVNLKAGTVVGGGVPGGGPVTSTASKGARLAAAAGKVFIIGAAVGVFAELSGILSDQSAANKGQVVDLTTKTKNFAPKATNAALTSAISGIDATQKRLYNEWSAEGFAFALNIDGVRDAVQAQEDTLRTQLRQNVDAATRAGERTAGAIAAIKPPSFNAQTTVTVNVTAAKVGQTVVVANRMGKQNGSYGGGRGIRSGALIY